jgi:hypothetical protein
MATNESLTHSGHRSRFGGLWVDRADALQVLERKRGSGTIDDGQAQRLREWIDKGFVVIEGAVANSVVDEINADVARAWTGAFPQLHVEYWDAGTQYIAPIRGEMAHWKAKLLNLYGFSEPARRAAFASPVLAFLEVLFERPPLAFQSLYFERGTEQPMHQDTVYVGVSSPMEMVGSWLALEDIRENSGELEYYVGSHRLPEYLWDGVGKRMPNGHPDHERYLAWIHDQAATLGLRREKFRPRRGDVVLWHADLAHGGSAQPAPDATRRSIVTHYCPVECDPVYFTYSRHSPKIPDPSGAFYCHQYFWGEEGSALRRGLHHRLGSVLRRLLARVR